MIRHFLLLSALAFFSALALSFLSKDRGFGQEQMRYALETKKRSTVSCGPDWETILRLTEAPEIPLIPGAGNHTWKISTNSDSAQRYFNQGMNMYYSFHIIEAMASFLKATRFDPECAMLYWAQALAYGPNINDLGYMASPEALNATQMAVKLSDGASDLEKALIAAMQVRYTEDSTDVTREKLNAAYTAMMQKAYERFPNHADVQALYADAMMLEHPWDLWYNNGTPKPWTPHLQKVLEKALVSHPNHPGANHYYIHVMEPSPYAEKALPSANRLDKLTPALSHTVHMPSHIFLRTGHYAQGIQVNEDAVKGYEAMVSLYAPAAGNDFIYLIHNLHMQTNVAMLAGKAAYSLQSAEASAKSIPAGYLSAPPPMGSYIGYIYMVPTLVNIRFGHWDNLLNAQKPADELLYANILYHFGRGMALAHKGKFADAKEEIGMMQKGMKDPELNIPFAVFSPALEGAKVAENILSGTIALAQNNFSAAVNYFETAVKTEENMVYTEPRDWLLNPKHYLGNAYLKAGNAKAAEETFRRDLLGNQENGWALFGLYQALLAQKKQTAAEEVFVRYEQAFAEADIRISAAVY
jgi:tetratricopeptide (TPR) repeat protein